jgi:hypothetical protein
MQMTDYHGADRYLSWNQPSAWRQEYEFREDGELAGWLVMDGGFRASARAELWGESWLFDRKGFWKPVTICADESGQAIAEYRQSFWGNNGEITVGSGRMYRLSSNFWMTRYKLEDETGLEWMAAEGIRGFLRSACDIRLGAGIGTSPDLAWLPPFMMYIILLHMRDSAVAAAAA